jgi:hypothetical protein
MVDITLLRSAVVPCAVFKDNAALVLPLFFKYSHWKSEERWNVVEERLMTRDLFLDLCRESGVLDLSDPALAEAVTKTLGWGDSCGCITQDFQKNSPLEALLFMFSAEKVIQSPSPTKKGGKKTVVKDRKSKGSALSNPRSKGCNLGLLRPITQFLARTSFDVVVFCRATPSATALDRQLHQSLIPKIGVTPPASSEGQLLTDLSLPALNYAAFCEILSVVAQQVVPLPFIPSAVRVTLLIERMFSAVFKPDL